MCLTASTRKYCYVRSLGRSQTFRCTVRLPKIFKRRCAPWGVIKELQFAGPKGLLASASVVCLLCTPVHASLARDRWAWIRMSLS